MKVIQPRPNEICSVVDVMVSILLVAVATFDTCERLCIEQRRFYLLLESNHFMNCNASVRLEKVSLFLPKLSVNAIDDLFTDIEATGKFTVIS